MDMIILTKYSDSVKGLTLCVNVLLVNYKEGIGLKNIVCKRVITGKYFDNYRFNLIKKT